MTAFDLEEWLDASASAPPPIVQAGAAVLRRRAMDVPPSLLGTKALGRLVEMMVATMRDAPGVGLAAPQIGVPLRVFVAEDDDERMRHVSAESRRVRGRVALPLVAVVNPSVTRAGGEATFFEGCLSVAGYGALVTRAERVAVDGVSPSGRPVNLRLEGWPARIMQHEGDHLDGTLYVDRMIARSFASQPDLARLSSMSVVEVERELVDRG